MRSPRAALPMFALLFAPAVLATAVEDPKDIVERAYVSRDFHTLYQAIKDAGLAETLKGEGPFTVLAPTDEAFSKLPEELRKDLFKPENKAGLARLLKHHVLPGKLTKEQVAKLDGKTTRTAADAPVLIRVEGDNVLVGGARVINADIECTNGVIHAVDTVLLPPPAR